MSGEAWKKDASPLALRVLPQAEEFFDSWLNRLVARHDTTKPELFEFLGLEPSYARLDLAGGHRAITGSTWVDVIARLAWGVGCDFSVLSATLVPTSDDHLLPVAARSYGCPQCWLEAQLAGQPPIVQREWVLRMSWYCQQHAALLVDLRGVQQGDEGAISPARLRQLAENSRQGFAALELSYDKLLVHRHFVMKLLRQPAPARPIRGLNGYMAEFAKNRLHVVPARTLLLAHAHCYNRDLPRRFARTFAVPACPGGQAVAPRPVRSAPPLPASLLARALCRIERQRLRQQHRRLDAAARRLSSFSYLLRGAGEGPDWQTRAQYALAAECRQRRRSETPLASLRLARDYAAQAERAGRRRWPAEPFSPERWGFALPPAEMLELAVLRLEAKGEKVGEATKPRNLP